MCKDYVVYKSFDELPEELKEKFKSGTSGTNLKKAKDGYLGFINLLNKRGDELAGDYINATIKTQVRFGKCGHTTNITPTNYKKDRGCGVCRGLQVQYGVNDLAILHPDLTKEWHSTKNGELMPYDVTQGSNKKVWWQCEHEHEWEATVADRVKGNRCPYCSNCAVLKGFNDVATTHPQNILYFVNIEDAYTHTHSSHDKVEMKCPKCGHIKAMIIKNLTSQGFSCDLCSDGHSFCEKLMASILTKLNIEFTKQMSFDNGKHKYDFYLPKYNVILETHGIQHYVGWLGDEKDLLRQQENDKYKRELAIKNGIKNKNYHEVDCRHGTLEYCRPNVEQALSNYIDMSIHTDEDWKQADIQAQKSLKNEVCDYWKDSKKDNDELTPKQVAEVFRVDYTTVLNYLKWGNINGFCKYETEGRGAVKLVYLINPDGKTKWFEEAMSIIGLERASGISQSTIGKNIDKGALKYHPNSKYPKEFIGSYIVSAEVYDSQTQAS